MRRILYGSAFLLAFAGSALAEEAPVAEVKCPEIKPENINSLKNNRFITAGQHKWYMQDAYHLPDTLGNHIPIGLSVEEVLNPQNVTFKAQLDAKTCQYGMTLANGQSSVITFKLVGG